MTWDERVGAPGNPGGVAPGKTRLILLGLGESGMSGRAPGTSGWPVGYPPGDSSVWMLDDSLVWRHVDEPSDSVGDFPLMTPVQDGDSAGGVGPGSPAEGGWFGFLGQAVQQAYGSSYEVGIVNCGKGGSTYQDWAVSGSADSMYGAARWKLKCALMTPNTVLHAICLMQGINNAQSGTMVWDTSWTAIMDQFRADLAIPAAVPTHYVQMPSLLPGDGSTQPLWDALRSQQAGWEELVTPPLRVMTTSPDGDIDSDVHLSTSANVTLAADVASALATYPGPTS